MNDNFTYFESKKILRIFVRCLAKIYIKKFLQFLFIFYKNQKNKISLLYKYLKSYYKLIR